jgi:DNA-binding transcriptional MocR family regulator
MTHEYDPLASVQAAGPPGTISFIYGLPDPSTFPAEDLRGAASQVLVERPELALQYGPEQGYGPLIDFLRVRLAREEGLAVPRAQMLITGGSTQSLDHVCTLFTRPGDIVLVEAPTYHESLQLLRDHHLRPLQVSTDGDGIKIEALALRLEKLTRRGERARMLYLIPSFQNPSGITLAADRRAGVLDLATRYDLLVVEDDVYRELAYGADVPDSLFASDGGQRVLRIGSFSKILAPGVRMGWLMGPSGLIERLMSSGLRSMSGGANPLVANILATYCLAGKLEAHIARLHRVYQERRDTMLASLEAHMPAGVTWTRPGGGFFVWLGLPEPLRAVDVAAQCEAARLMIPAGDPFFAEEPAGQYLRLAFSFVTPGKIEEGVQILGGLLHRTL